MQASSPLLPPAPPSQNYYYHFFSMVLDKHLTTVVNCLQNVVYVMMLVYFLEIGMFWTCITAISVSPVASWKGFAYNLWYGALVSGMMLAFKDTLEALILFENLKQHKQKDDRKKREEETTTTTTIAVNKTCAHIKHVDNGSTNNTTWQTLAGLILHRFFLDNKVETTTTNEAETLVQNEVDNNNNNNNSPPPTKSTTTTTTTTADDDIKQEDATSASSSSSSSARSTADTCDMLK
jgi:hypothetical protein